MKQYQRCLMLLSKRAILLLSLVFIQSCSLTDRQEDKTVDNNAEITSLGKDIIDMGGIPKSSPKATASKALNTLDNKNNEADSLIHEKSVTVQALTGSTETEKTQYQQFLAKQRLIQDSLSAKTKTRYKLALSQIKRKNWQDAIVLLDEVLAQSPDLSGAYLNKALSLYRLKQFDLAILTLQAEEKVNEINPYRYNLQGVLAREQGKFIESETYYQKALTVWPDYPEAHLNIAVLFELYRGKFVKAQTHYQAYLLLKPDDQKTKLWLAGLEIKIASGKGK